MGLLSESLENVSRLLNALTEEAGFRFGFKQSTNHASNAPAEIVLNLPGCADPCSSRHACIRTDRTRESYYRTLQQARSAVHRLDIRLRVRFPACNVSEWRLAVVRG